MDKPPGAATLSGMRYPALLALPLAAMVLIGADVPKSEPAKEAPKRASDGSHWEKAYPPAKPGMRRVVIHLEARPDEDDWKVEIIVGKVIETDGVNRVGMGGEIREETVQGWGYTYLLAEPKGVFSTRMAPPPGQKPVKAFVAMPPKGPFRHNSKLPVVVYVPEGHEVRYRLWQATTTEVGQDG